MRLNIIKQNILKYKVEISALSIVGIIYYIAYATYHPIGCLIYRSIGIECPTCGMASAYYHLLVNQDIKAAYYYHPLFFMVPIIVVLVFINFIYLKEVNKYINYMLYLIFIIFMVVYFLRIFHIVNIGIPLDNTFDFNVFKFGV